MDLIAGSHTIPLGGTTIRYIRGPANGPAVLLLHGVASSIEVWRRTVPALEPDFEVIALDLPGFGLSTPLPEPSIVSLSDVTLAFMDALGIERAHLVGTSLGGAIALRLAIAAPTRVESCAVVAPAAIDDGSHLLFRAMTLPLLGPLFTLPSRAGVAHLVRECFSDASHATDELIDFTYGMARRPGASRTLRQVVASIGGFRRLHRQVRADVADRLSEIVCPTMIVWGAEDRMLPPAHASIAAARMPDATVHLLPACGHQPQLECADDFNRRLVSFLNGATA